jgi:hypothetical protein
MKKPSTLAEQIQQAQREVNSWSAEMKASLRLQGMSSLSPRSPEPRTDAYHPTKTEHRKK